MGRVSFYIKMKNFPGCVFIVLYLGLNFQIPIISAQNDCAPAAMSKCTDPLKVVTDNKDLGFATSKEELIKMCPKLMDGLRCIDDFTLRCLDREHRGYLNTLYAGTTQVIVDLCQEGTYQSDYLRHAPCMRLVQAGYERCAADYQTRIKALNEQTQEEASYYDDQMYEYAYEYADSTEAEYIEEKTEEALETVPNQISKRRRKRTSPIKRQAGADYAEADSEENVRLLCCSFQKYLHCSETVVNTTCGYETAQFTKSFLDRMSGPLIQGHCQAYEYGSNGCIPQGNLPWDEYHHYSAYASGHRVMVSWPLLMFFTLCAKFILL